MLLVCYRDIGPVLHGEGGMAEDEGVDVLRAVGTDSADAANVSQHRACCWTTLTDDVPLGQLTMRSVYMTNHNRD